jgi:hypothetical protein
MGQKTKDKRVQLKRGAQDLTSLVGDVMEGKRTGRAGAEHHGFEAVKALVEVFLMDEGRLAIELRAFVGHLMDKADPLRADIPPDAWAALWPTLNTLVSARRQAEATIAQLKGPDPRQLTLPVAPGGNTDGERREEGGSAPTPDAGPGVLGVGDGRAEGGAR